MFGSRVALLSSRFDPRPLGNLALWLDASRLGLNDGDQVATWPDLSGLGNDAGQATASKRPLYKVGQAPSGLPAVKFDGIDDYLTGAGTVGQPATLFMVMKTTSTPSSGGWLVFDGIALVNRIAMGWSIGANGDFGIHAGATLTAAHTPNAWHVHGGAYNGASSVVHIDGAVLASGNAGTKTLAGYMLGAGYPPNFYSAVLVSEVLLYASLLAATDRQRVEAYLRQKWATP